MLNRHRPTRGVVVIYDEPESPNDEGACLCYMMNRNRPMMGVFQACEEPESPNGGRGDV